MRLSSRQKVSIGFILGLILFVISGSEAYAINVANQNAVRVGIHYAQVTGNLSSLLTGLDDAETSQRGFLITGNVTYLQPYMRASAAINSSQWSLQGLLAGDANLTSGFQRLRPIITEKLQELQQGIDIRKTQGFATSQVIVNTNVGNQRTNEIRSILAGMTVHVRALQSQEIALANQEAIQGSIVAVLGSALGTGVIILAVYTINENLAKEGRARREAELLQDILTHDIRNYNQISRTSAELLKRRFEGDGESEQLAARVIQSVDGSTELAERAQRLGRIVSQERPELHAVDLLQSIDRAMGVTKKAFPAKHIVDTTRVVNNTAPTPRVYADELLDEVFVNLFSNAAKFTKGETVPIDILIERVKAVDRAPLPLRRSYSIVRRLGRRLFSATLGAERVRQETARRFQVALNTYFGRIGQLAQDYWEISVADSGPGIPPERRRSIFTRYTSTKKGMGLGLSIVHALVVRRYQGEIHLRDNKQSPSNSGKGAIFVLSLKRA